jgi:SNF2 family DNA or RNA helicase
LAAKPKPRSHPFCAAPDTVAAALGWKGDEGALTLRLPTTRTGPRPSPLLTHAWDLDEDTPPFLAPWTVSGLRLSPAEACHLLLESLSLGEQGETGRIPFTPGDDVRFWHQAAVLALETLAAQKLVPVLAPAGPGIFHARWLPVLDGPKDGPRLARLESAMPPLCRAALSPAPAEGGRAPENPFRAEASPRALLTAYLNTTCDSLARRWCGPQPPRLPGSDTDPAVRWLAALFTDDPTVKASPAQLESLAAGHRAWMRLLHVAGDAAFRIAFRLDAPARAEKPDWQLHYLLQARDDPSLLIPAETVWKKTGGVLTELGRRFEQPQEKLLAGLGYAARLCPPIAGTLKGKRPARMALDTSGAYTFLRETAPLLESAGFAVLVPPWWNRSGARLGLRLKVQAQTGRETNQQGRMTLDNLIGYRWELAVGDTSLTEAEFRALADLKTPLVQIRGQWVQLDPEQIEAAIRFWENRERAGEMDLLEALQFGLGGQTEQDGLPVDEVLAEGDFSDWLERFKQPDSLTPLASPAGLLARLRPYQQHGFSWLHFHRRNGLGACLADDMGLGKTIQTLTLLLHEKETRGLPAPTLLICPTSVVTNWARESARFTPSLAVHIHQGPDRLRGEAFREAALGAELVLTSYALARLDAGLLQDVDWLGVVLDEAQNIKNPTTKQTQAIRRLKAGFRFALTGTPVENRLSELWSIMHFLNPGYLGPRKSFRTRFALPIERYQDADALQRLRQLTGPFILRRVKTDPTVIRDLPAKVETKVYCRLTEEQATLYEAVVQDAIQKIETQDEGIERRGMVLSMLMQLKQICNHPAQYLHQAGAETGGNLAKRSGKLERLAELLEELLAAGDRALIFTQFAEMGELLAGFLPQAVDAAVQFLHGGTPPKQRDKLVRRFQEDAHPPPIFILSLKAGGTGLNLTRANHVFHFDRWWNPAVEDQATDRAFRIGQDRNVQVHKFVVTGTLEEMIDDMIESKKGLAQAVVGSGEGWLTELDTAELHDLVRLRSV